MGSEESCFSTQVRNTIRVLSEKLRVDAEAVRWLFPLFFVVLSNERDEAQKDKGCGERTSWSACFRYYAAHRDELRILL